MNLRKHQKHIVEKLRMGFRDGHKMQLFELPLGYGKSAIIGEWISRCINIGKSVVVISMTRSDNEYLSSMLKKWEIKHLVVQGDMSVYPYRNIDVILTTSQKWQRLKEEEKPRVDVFILHETDSVLFHMMRRNDFDQHIDVIGINADDEPEYTNRICFIGEHIIPRSSYRSVIQDIRKIHWYDTD